jgi:cold shock CspA family protein
MQLYSDIVRKNRRRATMAAASYGRHGVPAAGRIVKLMVGQGHGFIRSADDREVYFHRGDLEEGTSINDLTIGDTVAFEHFDDTVSGPKALRVRRGPVPVAGCGGAMNQDD